MTEDNEFVIDDSNQTFPISVWKNIYHVGGVSAFIIVIVTIAEIAISFIPGEYINLPTNPTAIECITLFQNNWFMGLRDLGLFNIIIMICTIPLILALCSLLKRINHAAVTIAVPLAFIGITTYFAKNTAFTMLYLSNEYATATGNAQQSILSSAETIMALSDGHAGAMIGFLLIDFACIMFSVIMLRSKIFGKTTGYFGILANFLFMIYEIISDSSPAWYSIGLYFALIAGVLIIIWYVLLGLKFIKIGHFPNQPI